MGFHMYPEVSTRYRPWILLLAITLCSGLLSGQQTASNAKPATLADTSPQEVYKSEAVIVVNSDLVLIPVTVTDHSGRTVVGLGKEHFQLFEDTAPQQITHFTAENVPVSLGIVVDTSGSMQPRISKAREAVNTLLGAAKQGDEFFLVRFSTEARLVVPLTTHADEIRAQTAALTPSGTTALLDGVRLAMTEISHARNRRKAIVVISDGEDNSSSWTVPELKAMVREQDILIYAIGIHGPPNSYADCVPGHRCGTSLLHEISSHTGGQLFEVDRVKQLPDIAARIGSWLRNQYVLGYMPNRSERDGTYRKVQLKITRPKGYPRLHAVWRQGYYAPKQ
jgi:VWFA-related protein